MKRDVGIRRIVQNELHQPVKIISNQNKKEDTELMVQTDMIDEFKRWERGIIFPNDYWMETFDRQEDNQETRDEQARGFVNGHADIGWGREGVSQSAEASQRGNQNVLCPRPHLIHKNKFDYTKLGNLPDKIQLLADKYILDHGERIMPPSTMRDEDFGKILREKCNLKLSRFESFTIVRQLLGEKVDVDKVSNSHGMNLLIF